MVRPLPSSACGAWDGSLITPHLFYHRERAFELLFQRLAPVFPTLFPSSTIPPAFGPNLYAQQTPGGIDGLDMPVWQMLSSMALHANMQQQQTLVGELREKVLENVVASKQRWGTSFRSSPAREPTS